MKRIKQICFFIRKYKRDESFHYKNKPEFQTEGLQLLKPIVLWHSRCREVSASILWFPKRGPSFLLTITKHKIWKSDLKSSICLFWLVRTMFSFGGKITGIYVRRAHTIELYKWWNNLLAALTSLSNLKENCKRII